MSNINLTVAESKIVASLFEEPYSSFQSLAVSMRLTPSELGRLISNLKKKGIIDGDWNRVRLTEVGERVAHIIKSNLHTGAMPRLAAGAVLSGATLFGGPMIAGLLGSMFGLKSFNQKDYNLKVSITQD